MARVKVQLADNIKRVVFVDPDATVGATIGTDLKMPDGSIATAASLTAYLGIATTATTQAHRLLAGLSLGDDHPQYTRKDTLTTRGDLYVRDATTVARLAIGSASKFLQSDGTDPAWQTISPTVTLSTDLSGNVTLTNLTSGTLAATITSHAVTDSKIRQSGALSVIGNSTNATADVADISASADGDVLRRSGTALGFGNIGANPSASIGLTAVNGTANTYLRSDAAPALDVGISPTWSGTHTFSNTPVVPNQSWTYAKIQNVSATSRFLGRVTAGAGTMEELTGTQATALLDVATVAANGLVPAPGSSTGKFLQDDLTWASAGGSSAANPTASVGLTAVNGVASTFMRSDAAPPLDVSIAPIWTSNHTWSSAEPRLLLNESDASTNLKLWDIDVNGSVLKFRSRTDADGAGSDFLALVRGTTTTFSAIRVGPIGNTLGTNDSTFLMAASSATIDCHAQDTPAVLRTRRYNGSMTSSPTEIQNGQTLGQFVFQAYSSSGTAVRSPAFVAAIATETWALGAVGTKLTINTTTTGSSTASFSLTLQGDQVQHENGLVTAPSITFRNDLDCGWYRIGANNIGASVNGAKVLDVSTTGLGVTGTVVASGAISGSNLSSSGGANPSASIGLTAVNGSATTYMRSDAAPALDLGISPTWTGTHAFSSSVNSTYGWSITNSSTGTSARGQCTIANSAHAMAFAVTSTLFSGAFLSGGPTGESATIFTNDLLPLVFGTNATYRMSIGATGDVVIANKFAINGGTPTAQLTGFGSPSGTVTSGLTSSATLAQTAGTLAALLAYLKTIGFIGA